MIWCLPGSTKPAKQKTSLVLSSLRIFISSELRVIPFSSFFERLVWGRLQMVTSFSGKGKFSLNLASQSYSLRVSSFEP